MPPSYVPETSMVDETAWLPLAVGHDGRSVGGSVGGSVGTVPDAVKVQLLLVTESQEFCCTRAPETVELSLTFRHFPPLLLTTLCMLDIASAAGEGIEVVQTGARMPRMNAIMERWIRSCRTELLDRTLIWHHAHLVHALREYEEFYNQHRPPRALTTAAPLRPLPEPLEPDALVHLDVRRCDRLGGILHEYQNDA